MLDESLLDAPEALARADHRGLLRGAAEAGARVRTAARHAVEAGIAELQARGPAALRAGRGPRRRGGRRRRPARARSRARPRRSPACTPPASPPPPAPCAGRCPAGPAPLDLLLIATTDGTEPGLALLAEQAYRRGCTVVAVAPAALPARRSRGRGARPRRPAGRGAPSNPTGREMSAASPGAFWALFTPLLALARPGRPAQRAPGDHRQHRRTPGPRRRALRPRYRHLQQPGQDPGLRTRRIAAADLDRRRGRGTAGRRFAAVLSRTVGPPRARRRAARGAARPRRAARGRRSRPAPTPTTSSATASRSPERAARPRRPAPGPARRRPLRRCPPPASWR